MLVLTRREGETLIINDDIKVTVLSIKGNQVRIGIDAPQEIPVHREELLVSGGLTTEKEPIKSSIHKADTDLKAKD